MLRYIGPILLTMIVAAAPASANPTVIDILRQIPVHAADSMDGYSRSEFGAPWADDNDDQFGHNGCDTRDDILARDLENVVREGRCKVVSGVLHDPYTGRTIEFQRGRKTSTRVQIDHLVPLADAWRTGAQRLSPQERVNLANDPRNLLAVDGPANESKGGRDASEWLPPNRAFRCAYVARQAVVKAAYRLFATPMEKNAMTRILSSCGQ